MPGGINEYVIKLSTQIDNPGVSQILSLLDSTKLKAAALTTVFATATTAIYKFISSAAEKELELKSLAAQQKKNIENLREQQAALTSMGKTLQQINKDKTLKETYKDIVNFNKSFTTMDISGTVKKIESLRGAFWKLKSAISLTIQEIGKRVLVNLEGPIDRITGKLNKFSNWIRDHFVSLTSKIASFVTAFAKGLLTIVNTVEKIATFFNSLPGTIKAIAAAMTAVVLVLKSGPIGLILSAIEAIGAIKDDLYVYRWNKQNRDPSNKNPLLGDDGKPVQKGVALEAIWDIWDSEGDMTEKFGKIATLLLTRITEAMNNAFDSEDGKASIASIFAGKNGDGTGGILGTITGWLKDESNQKALSSFGGALVTFIQNAFTSVGGLFGGAAGGLIEAIFGAQLPEELFNDDKNATTFAGFFGGLIGGFFKKIGEGGSAIEALAAGMGTGILSTIVSAFIANLKKKQDGSVDWAATFTGMGDSLKVVGEGLLEMLVSAVSGIENLGTSLFTAIGNAISDEFKGEDGALKPIADVLRTLGKENSIIGEALTDGLVAGLMFGGPAGLITGIAKLIKGIVDNPGEFESEINEISDSFAKLWQYVWEGIDDPQNPGQKKGGWLKKLIYGDEDNPDDGIAGWLSGAWESVSETVHGWIDSIGRWVTDMLTDAVNSFIASHPGLWWITGKPGATAGEDQNGNIVVTGADGTSLTGEAGTYTAGAKGALKALSPYIAPNQNGGFDSTGASGSSGLDLYLYSKLMQLGVNDPSYMKVLGGGDIQFDMGSFFASIFKGGALPGGTNGEISFDDLFADWNKEHPDQKIEIPMEVKTDEVENQAESGRAALQAAANNKPVKYPITTDPNGNGGEGGTQPNQGPLRTSASAGASSIGGNIGQTVSNYYGGSGGQSSNDGAPKSVNNLGNAADTSSGSLGRFSGVTTVAVAALLRLSAASSILQTKFNNFKMPTGKSALGGRFGQSTITEVGEDGTEYIIPITKPERAASLINQMFGEMGAATANKILSGLGIGQNGTIGANMASIGNAMSGLVMNNTYNISAPVSINVTSTGASAEEVGTQAYNLAERHLIKTLRGVYA